MKHLTLLALLSLTVITVCRPIEEEENFVKLHRSERSIFGLGAFILSFLNAILAINLNTSINRQNAEHGGIIGG
jgi:hypothetical protein